MRIPTSLCPRSFTRLTSNWLFPRLSAVPSARRARSPVLVFPSSRSFSYFCVYRLLSLSLSLFPVPFPQIYVHIHMCLSLIISLSLSLSLPHSLPPHTLARTSRGNKTRVRHLFPSVMRLSAGHACVSSRTLGWLHMYNTRRGHEGERRTFRTFRNLHYTSVNTNFCPSTPSSPHLLPSDS